MANDGTLDSAPATVSLNVHLNIAPVVTAFDQSAARGQVFNASDLFSATDGDGDALLYFFYDNSADPASGHFTVNGVVQAANTTFAVTAAQLAQTTFTAGQLSDDLFVNAWDFSLFSGPQEFHVNVPANQAPTVTAADFSASKGQVVSASDLFTANDANGDPLLYFFYDNSADPASGHFTVNGVVQAAGTTFAVTAAQLATTTFTAGTAVSDDLFVNAWDGIAFSGPKEFHVNVVNNAPTVTAPNQTASSGQVLNASSLFTANDADGDSLLYFFYDNSAAPTSGHFDVNGVAAGGRHDLRGDAGATGEYDVRRGNHGRRPVRECLGWRRLQRTEGVPHRHRVSTLDAGVSPMADAPQSGVLSCILRPMAAATGSSRGSPAASTFSNRHSMSDKVQPSHLIR